MLKLTTWTAMGLNACDFFRINSTAGLQNRLSNNLNSFSVCIDCFLLHVIVFRNVKWFVRVLRYKLV